MRNPFNLTAVPNDAFGLQEPGGEFKIASGRAHGDAQRSTIDANLQRLFGNQIVDHGLDRPSLHCWTVVMSTLLPSCAIGVLRGHFPLPRQAETYAEGRLSASRSWDGSGSKTGGQPQRSRGEPVRTRQSLAGPDRSRVNGWSWVQLSRCVSIAGFCFGMSLG